MFASLSLRALGGFVLLPLPTAAKMPPAQSQTFHVADQPGGLTLVAVLKRLLPDHSWSQVRKLIAARRVQVNGNLVLDEGRKVKPGDVIRLWEHSLSAPVGENDVRLAYFDEHLVVV